MIETPQRAARLAGLLYVVIILGGLGAELGIRMALIEPGDAKATAAKILANEGLFRLALGLDLVMGLADAAVAVLFYLLLRPAGAGLALAAMVFRLVQTAILGGNLIHQQAALLALTAPGLEGGEALALLFSSAQAFGYDLGLAFFGVSCLLTGALIWRSGFLPRLLGLLLAGAGAVYLCGSALRVLSPALAEGFAPAYALPLLAETALALWLLIRGVDPARWRVRAAA